jgi:hypothetical protein
LTRPDTGQGVKWRRRYRTIEVQADPCTVTAADPLPDDLKAAVRTYGTGPLYSQD